MEKLDKVIAGLECCTERRCTKCPYLEQERYCMSVLEKDALEWLKEQNRLIRELSDNIPCCDNCEGKTVFGERTDKCVYEIEGLDSVLYCAKRGVENCFGYRKKIEELEAKLKESEPVVHAHWVRLTPDQKLSPFSDRTHCCSNCGKHGYKWYDRCWSCGAMMDEKVFEPTPLIRLDLGGRINKRLKQMGVTTVEQLETLDKHTLHNIPGLGRRSIEIIESELRIWKELKEKKDELLER